ncbi:complex I subunit 5 family protein [Sediminivirga luteola]|uniref:complex I subunit 5 family protein n=1 Tax=Sediminivirga luteola TaxID=1774748 RepID=UPI001F599223|nr:proton-conducting transporter membrane subunit [Sediminivirga luteola]MCI2265359.1 formate hydrogenlyase [Sediminivirga luteola]
MIWILVFGLPLTVAAVIGVCALLRMESLAAAGRAARLTPAPGGPAPDGGPAEARPHDDGTEPLPELLSRLLCRFGWLAAVPAGVAALTGPAELSRVDWMVLGTSVQMDALARPLLGMTAVLYGLALAFIPRSGVDRGPALTAFLLLCFAGNAGVFLAADIVTFYLSFTVMSFTGYLLVVHSRSRESRRAGRIYLVMTVLGECAVLAGLLLVARTGITVLAEAPAAVAESPHRDAIIALLLIGFGVKAGTVPLHVWLPLAHPAAPTPASAVLSGAMVKAGLAGWLRFLPLGESEPLTGWGTAFMVLALAGGFLAVPIGLLQDNPKVILAYSSISQMGFLAALVGAALAVPELAGACIVAATVYAVHHGLAKGALFLGVQVWDRERLPRAVVVLGLVMAGLSVIGAPLTGGYVAKYGAKEAVGDASVPAAGGFELAEVLPWVGLGSTLLLARFAVVLWRRDRRREPVPALRGVAWACLALFTAVPVALVAAARPAFTMPGWADPAALWGQSWPLLLGTVLAVAAAAVARRGELEDNRWAHPRGDTVPPGDLIAVEERAAAALLRLLRRGMATARGVAGDVRERVAAAPSPLAGIGRVQERLGTWTGSGVLLLLVLAAAAWWTAMRGGS